MSPNAGPPSGTVIEAWQRALGRVDHREAVRCGRTRLSYRELDARSDSIAAGLASRGIGSGSLVGLFLSRSIDTVAAILGVLKAGAAYVPFDPAYPAAQLQFILDDCAPRVVLTQAAMRTRPAAVLFEGRAILDLDRDFPAAERPFVSPAIAPGDRAYVMYTSGSTGRPKGVQVPHRAITRLVLDTDYAAFGPDEIVLHLAPLAFDASTFELWAALLHGGCLAIVPQAQPSLDEIAAVLREQRVSTAWLTAGLFHLMVDHQLDALGGLRQLLAGGDVLSVPHVDRLLAAHPHIRLINGYGPTENTTFSCCHTIVAEREPGPIPIGRPIRHSEALILDDARQPVPAGEIGELYVSGQGLALGYLNRPELDAERFLPHPQRGDERVYRTGDRVRQRPDGVLEFHGRADRQVKINGKRVELDEIEATLRRHPAVGDAAVLSPDAAGGERRVHAFACAKPGAKLVEADLRLFLRAELPDYMLPATLQVLDHFPLTPTGKVDRAALPLANAPVAASPVPVTPPATGLEADVLTVWREVLGREAIGLDDNFFDLGGSSLQMLRVHAALAPRLPRPVSIVDLFTYPRIRALVAWLNPVATAPAASPTSAAERARRQQAALARLRPGPPTTRP